MLRYALAIPATEHADFGFRERRIMNELRIGCSEKLPSS